LDALDALITANFAAAGTSRSYFATAKMINNATNFNIALLEHSRGFSFDNYRNGIGKYFGAANQMQAMIGTGTANVRTNRINLNAIDDYLFSAFVSPGVYLQFFTNGSLIQNLSTTAVPVIDASSQVSVGATANVGAASWLQSEAIYYDNSNEFSNRVAIEGNINTYYGIY
jgi:hypothetical protein